MKINKIEAGILAEALRIAKYEITEDNKIEHLFEALESLSSKLYSESRDERRYKTDRCVSFDFRDNCQVFAQVHIAKTTKSV